MLGIVNAVLVIGALISGLGAVLLANLVGSGDYLIRHLTSRSLGSLPPGYAASKRGFQVYALVVLAIGLVFLGVSGPDNVSNPLAIGRYLWIANVAQTREIIELDRTLRSLRR